MTMLSYFSQGSKSERDKKKKAKDKCQKEEEKKRKAEENKLQKELERQRKAEEKQRKAEEKELEKKRKQEENRLNQEHKKRLKKTKAEENLQNRLAKNNLARRLLREVGTQESSSSFSENPSQVDEFSQSSLGNHLQVPVFVSPTTFTNNNSSLPRNPERNDQSTSQGLQINNFSEPPSFKTQPLNISFDDDHPTNQIFVTPYSSKATEQVLC